MYARDGLLMRTVERRDLEPLRQMHNHPDTLYVLSDPVPVTESDQEAWYRSLGRGKSRRYVIEESGSLVALVRLDEIDSLNRSARIGLDVMVEKRGQGYGRRCYDLLLTYCFGVLGLNMVWLFVAEFNERASGLYLSIGFRAAGVLPEALWRDGKFRDMVLMALLASDWRQGAKGDGP